jgi:peroxiredoxin
MKLVSILALLLLSLVINNGPLCGQVAKQKLSQEKAANTSKTSKSARKESNTVAPKTKLEDAYSIKVNIKNIKDVDCYLAYHMGDKQYLADTAHADSEGNMVFTGTETLDAGIYMVVIPSRKYFEMIVAEQKFSVTSDSNSLSESLAFSGSRENEIFLQYINFVSKKGQELNEISKRISTAPKDSAKIYTQQIRDGEEEIAAFRRSLAEKNPGTFIANILRALSDPKRPEPPLASNGRPDSAWRFYDNRAHYLDNIDFSDARLLRTPILLSRVKYYTEKLAVPDPDSIAKACDNVLDRAQANKEVFRYLLWYLSNNYETSKFMGMDAVFSHLSERYYLSGKADWIDSATKAKIGERVATIKPLLIGKTAPRLMMSDSAGKRTFLTSIASPYTVIAFYDPNCGHCQKDIPELNALYEKELKAKGIEVIAACGERNPKDWRNFIRKHKLSFINWFDSDTVVDFRKFWDVYSYPVIYLFDADKKIIAKRIAISDITSIVNQLDKSKGRTPTSSAKAASGSAPTQTGAPSSNKKGKKA